MINMSIYTEEWHPVYEISYPEDGDITYKIPEELVKEYILAINNFKKVQYKIAKLLNDNKYYFPGNTIQFK